MAALYPFLLEGKNKLRLNVSVRYDMGLLPDTRGGTSWTWQLERRNGQWVVTDKDVTMHYD